MRIKLIRAMRKPPRPEVWTAMISIAVTLALLLTFVPMQMSIGTGGLLSVSFNPEQVQAQEPDLGEVAELRGENSKTFYVGDRIYRAEISSGTLHYQDTQGIWQDINNGLIQATAPWDWQMTTDSYRIRVLEDFTYGQVLRFEVQGEYVAFQPMALEWTNDLGQADQISMPQSGTLSVTNIPMQLLTDMETGYEQGIIRWDNAYGIGRHFEWNPTPGMLKKLLQLDSAPPEPPDYIKTGGNPALRLNFIFEPSPSMDIYVDGVLWDKKSKVSTFSSIEFRKGDEVLWLFSPVLYWDSSEYEEQNVGVSTLRKVGNKLYISSLVPYGWFQTAQYPVFIDPSPYTNQAASKDNYINAYASTTNYGTATTMYVGIYWSTSGYIQRSLVEFDVNWGTDIPDGVTITSAIMSLYKYSDFNDCVGRTYNCYRLAAGRLAWEETEATWAWYRLNPVPVNWATAGASHNPNDYTPTDGAQQTVPANGNWMSWTITNQVKTAQTGNTDVACRISDNTETASEARRSYFWSAEYATTSLRPKLVIAYTVPAPEITNTPDNYGFGILQIGTSSNTSINYFSINNTGNCAVDITIQGTNLTAGDDTWELSPTATPGENICGLMAGLDDADDLFDVVVNLTANAFVANLDEAVTQAWGLNLSMPTSLSGFDGNALTGNITLVASEAA